MQSSSAPAPPGYLGHRETKPLLTQERLSAVTSSDCDLSLVLFDEVEKAALALSTLLLGILDKGTLTAAMARVLEHHIDELQRHVHTRLGDRSFEIEVSQAARDVLLSRGVSAEYGARELKRTIHRLLTQPLAALVASARITPGTRVLVDRAREAGDTLSLTPLDVPASSMPPPRTQPRVLLLDDNVALLGWLEAVLRGAGFETVSVGTAAQAREEAATRRPDVAMLDVVLPDGDGVALAAELKARAPGMQLILMTGTELSPEEVDMCERHDIPVLRKPFLGQDAINLIQARRVHQQAARTAGGS